MRSRLHLAILAAAVTCQAEIIDRIAVTVGKLVISQSEVIRDLRVAALLDQKPIDLSGEQRHKTADRLVDQSLILQEADFTRAPSPTAEEAADMLEQVKATYPDEAGYRAALERYRVTEEELTAHLVTGLRALRFTELRFRPEVQVSPDELREYYDRTVSKQPGQVPSFEQSREQIEKLLTDQRVTQALDRWLGMQRTSLEILYRDAAFK